MPGKRKHSDQYWQVYQWRNQETWGTGFCSSRDRAIQVSYRAFVSGEGFPEAIVSPDNVTFALNGGRKTTAAERGDQEGLTTLWDEWLHRHPEERAEWDSGSRAARLRALAEQHVPNPRPFTSEHIVAHPDWYRRLYALLGMSDEMFDTLLHLHRFAVADQEAQRRANASQSGGFRPRRSIAAIYLDADPTDPEPPHVPLEKQAKACRAYCKRMGYKIHHVYQTKTPIPQDVPLIEEIGIGAGHAFVYYRHDSNHPFHVVHNLLAAGTIDVIVQFTMSGPSRSLYGTVTPEAATRLSRIELASLWEIEPPTKEERRRHDLIERISEVETEEERAALIAQLRTLKPGRKNVDQSAGKRVTVSIAAPALQVAEEFPEKPKVCYGCGIRPVREGSAFCSATCAQAAAEQYVQATTRSWCGACGTRIGSAGCPHSR